ncbi:aminotransferase class I/II-fold pyridoxal phosphate-dependent enzyme [Paenibacillus sediminis]|uniref:Arginine/lysine/ornithine decarboxylase n=1 Tax=Paenibacillus sediminis TaxID=664909 RepID=A0ABS4H7A8_9BACL|nr:aminotransferase class I/II-fold pyridoxal phosphate-dependent enzyme [Paenibacillus sediminis]MBP1938417.1 arginine/lysine/ornithine decarboxylase [Paenibacillus sediminis]
MDKKNDKAPLYDALLDYKNHRYKSFHVPGHKNGQVYINAGRPNKFSEVMEIDLTEIIGTDDLHHPEGVIREAQELAARCFGAEQTFFLVGGSTVGNLALILSVCTEPGDILLVQRNVHKSVLNGLMLAGANAVFLAPQVDVETGLATTPSVDTVNRALERYPHAKGLLVTSPNYYGMGTDLTSLAEACHSYGIPLLVDEAHGAHYGQHPALPRNALASGADGVVQSTHKMLAAMTMGAMLHIQGKLLNRELIRQRLAIVQSSSPSYPIMASLDLSRHLLDVEGDNLFHSGLAVVEAFKNGLNKIPHIGLLQPSTWANDAYITQDPFKVVLYDKNGKLSGYDLQRELERYGCIPEMSDERYVVLVFSIGSTTEDAKYLLEALQHIYEEAHQSIPFNDKEQIDFVEFSTWNNTADISEPVPFRLSPVSQDRIDKVTVQESAGRTAAEMIIPYPPGIPIVYPGELITDELASKLIKLSDQHVKCQGTADPTLKTIRVYIIDESRKTDE